MKRVKIAYNLIKAALGITDCILVDEEHELWEPLLQESNDCNSLGCALGLKNVGEDIKLPGNENLVVEALEHLKMHRSSKPSTYKHPDIYTIFINLPAVLSSKGMSLRQEIPWWYKWPLSETDSICGILVHELTHVQMDKNHHEACRRCVICSHAEDEWRHCKEFDKVFFDNWMKLFDLEMLRRVELACLGVNI